MATPMESLPLSLDEFKRHIGRMGYPIAPIVLAEQAERNGAPKEFVAALNSLPNRIYMSDKDAWEEYLKAVKPKG